MPPPTPLPLKQRLSAADTIGEYELAREDRYWDGWHLAAEGRAMGAIYLFGYMAEITLKCAYFRRVTPPQNTFLINANQLSTARAVAKAWGLPGSTDNFHSLLLWRELLCAERRRVNDPLEATIEKFLITNSAIIEDNWSIDMRYKQTTVSQDELEKISQAAEWFYHNYENLWK
jgi:hypothetical protein